MTLQDENPPRGLLRKTVFSLAASILLLAALLFIPAGLGWRRGWWFFLVFWSFTAASSLYLWRVNPEIFVARSRVHPGTKSWDKPLMVLLLVSILAIVVTATLDARYAWSAVSTRWVVAGYVLFALGFIASTWVYTVNKFAEPSVRIQSERGHQVVETGPYAIVRHPLYAASIVLFVAISLALGSYWALIPAAVGTLVLIVRILFEDRVLQRELAGYQDYASRVRFRLIPGIW